mmetsp:Transcript_98843/g.176067  ORF Transcript_98843/g.176067 Transcript_98843/m.176067 type:complete len:126 (+) Transcript_98843:79-456(+)|eukprot:CAMPEP_0197652886 /NCGR_PEP_ID=MMETSP1338-20131121/34720_1 /TAXON_ID=43686 ORGANISM="Pelagodinium beii, Strain RCC1491" /NCGR_SAMPLE_ID=MMETSP1338 /ASSEMBLY_ACC=CAM_ASM_000754 /LENGTH=125 /DNA_ID=CAMNT_0043227849 /DNA_START=77 /DNA_END=454 /DNA_ORIENTATION=+
MASWKQNFKAHRVAANMGNLQDNFLYHREMESFPAASGASMKVKRRAATFKSKLRQGVWTLRKMLLPGGNRGLVGIGFGLALPITGSLVMYSFVSMSSGHATQELYNLQLEKQQAIQQAQQAQRV